LLLAKAGPLLRVAFSFRKSLKEKDFSEIRGFSAIRALLPCQQLLTLWQQDERTFISWRQGALHSGRVQFEQNSTDNVILSRSTAEAKNLAKGLSWDAMLQLTPSA